MKDRDYLGSLGITCKEGVQILVDKEIPRV